MTVIRPRPPTDPLELTVAGEPWCTGTVAEALELVRGRLVRAPAGLAIAPRMLSEYDTCRPESRLFAVLRAASRMRAAVDRVVIVAESGLGPGTRLLAAACCHPFHDQLARGDRGGRPRLSWLDGRSSPDDVRGLLDVIAPPGRPLGDDLLDRWMVLAVDAPADDPASLAVVQTLLEARGAVADPTAPPPLVAITRPGSHLDQLAAATSGAERFPSGDAIDAPLGLLAEAGLLPAAIAGIDVVQLLKGATAMWIRFAEASVASNPVLADAAVSIAAAAAGRPTRRFAVGNRCLECLPAWHRWLRPARLTDAAFVTRLEGGAARRERLAATEPTGGAGLGSAADAEPADLTIQLPRIDEHAVGQLLQLLALSAAVEEQVGRGV